jgi:polyisoprenoid-binding protein YceI
MFKKVNFKAVLGVFGVGVALLSAPVLSEAAKKPLEDGTYIIDGAHSSIGFDVQHLVISTVQGRFNGYEGKIEIGKEFNQAKFEVSIDTASIDTAHERRDGHLRSADFFEVEKHPKMTFKSKRIEGTPESFKVIGDLTIRGVTKEVTLDGHYLGSVIDGQGNTKAAFTAETKVKREDFGLTWSRAVEVGPVVGSEVSIKIRVQAEKQSS